MDEGIWHVIELSDTLSSLAKRFSIINWELIYNHSENAVFRSNRPNPNVIYPGDIIWLPGVKGKEGKGKSGASTVFVKKETVTYFNLELVDTFGLPHNTCTKLEVSDPSGTSQ